jgi:serine acetyltransferase
MSSTTLFDASYRRRRHDLMPALLERLRPSYSDEELGALRIDSVNPEILAQRSGRGFVNRDILETLLGNLLECVAPGSHNALDPEHTKSGLEAALAEVADQLYAMVAQSFLAAGDEEEAEDAALAAAFALLWQLPRLKERAQWNRFAALKDPAVWDAYLLHNCGLSAEQLVDLDCSAHIETAIEQRDFAPYRRYLKELHCDFIFDYQMQLVMSTYPGWRVLFYHDIAHELTRAGDAEACPNLQRQPVPLLPRAIAELGGRYYQADLHPETRIGDANFIEHPHRGLTSGQTGIIGSGCHIFPCTLGGLTERVHQRHPIIGDYVLIGTDAGLYGRVAVGDHAVIGPNTEIYGLVQIGSHSHIGPSVVIGTIKDGPTRPGHIRLGSRVRIGSGTIIENRSQRELVIPDGAELPALSYVINDGEGRPQVVRGSSG